MTETEQTDKAERRKQIPVFLKASGSIILLLLTLLLIGYYVLFPSRGYFHSDTTDTIMWAEASYESGSLFNPDFAYACLLPFGTSLIMTALIPLTGVSMTTHVIGMFCFFLLFAGALILMLRQMKWESGWISAAVFLILMLCSGSTKLREIFWGHTIYYSLGIFFIFIGLSLIFWYLDLTADKKRKPVHLMLCIILTGIWFVLTCSDQIIAITIFALPVIGAVFCERFLDRETKLLSVHNAHTGILLFVMITGMIAGFFLTKMLAGEITAGYEEAYSQYSDMSLWADNFRKFPTAWFSLLGAEISANSPLMSAESVKSLLIIITGVLLLLLPFIALLCWNRIQDAKLRILILTYWFMTLLIMMGYIMGKLSAANWRLSPVVAMSAVVSVAFLRWACAQADWQRLAVLLLIPVTLVSGMHAITIISMPKDNTAQNELYALAEELESRNLTYGYATFWQANAITIISDSRVKCRSIEVDESGYWLRMYQCNETWYTDQPGQENYFLLLSDWEAQCMRSVQSPLLLQTDEQIKINGYEIWIMHQNIL